MIFFFQAEDGIRDRSPSRGLGDVYKRQFANRAQNTLLKQSYTAHRPFLTAHSDNGEDGKVLVSYDCP